MGSEGIESGNKRLFDYINNPGLIKTLSIADIDKWIEQAPYMQNLHLIKAIKLKSEQGDDPSLYHKTATVMTDRLRLQKVLDQTPLSRVEDEDLEDVEMELADPSTDEGEELIIDRGLLNIDNPEDSITPSDTEEIVGSEPKLEPEVEAEIQSEIRQEQTKFDGKTAELTEFSQWLLALEGPNDEVDEERVDKSVSFGDAAISETLAEIFEKQGHIEKAIEMYEKLRLINPEKSAYFAALIEKLKDK